MRNSLILFIVLFVTFSLFTETAFANTIDSSFDTRRESSMTAESFDKHFHTGKLSGYGKLVLEEAKKNGINAGFMSGIMAEETGWGRNSDMLNEINNPGGLTCKKGSSGEGWKCVGRTTKNGNLRYWKSFDSVEIAIKEKAAYLKRKYHDTEKVYTILAIQKIYCPDGDGCSNWVSGVTRAMATLEEGGSSGMLKPGEGSGQIDMNSIDDRIAPSIFSDYKIDIDNTGINDKKNHDTKYVDYKVNKYVKYIIEFIGSLTFALGIISLGYLSLLWLFILIARTNFEPAYKIVDIMTFNKIDAFEDMGKSVKFSLFLILFISVSMSGLMPLIFAFIYSLFSGFIVNIFRL